MPKKEDKEKPPKPVPQPSEPMQKKDKGKKDKEKEKLKNAVKLQDVEVSAVGSITSGTWVADVDTSKIRKNTLRVGA